MCSVSFLSTKDGELQYIFLGEKKDENIKST